MLLGYVLGPLMEENLRRAMLIARGDPMTFLYRPISAGLLAVAVLPAGACRAADDPGQAGGGLYRERGLAPARRRSLRAGPKRQGVTGASGLLAWGFRGRPPDG